MGCLKLSNFHSAELKIISSKKVLTSKKSENYARSGYMFGYNGMEKDNEMKGIGNSLDFGARMYDTRLGRWLSLDPLAAKYPSLSPYNFVANNPIYLIDKDGKEIWITPRSGGDAVKYTPGMSYEGDKFVENTVTSLNYIYNNGADINNAIKTASADGVETKISYTKNAGKTHYDPADKSIKWNDEKGWIGRGKNKDFKRSAALLLFHEIGHRDNHKNVNPNEEFDDKAYRKLEAPADKKDGHSFPNKKEQIATDYENKAAEILNQKGANESKRKNYNLSVEYKEMESPISTTPKAN